MEKRKRNAYFGFLLGHNRTGKSTLLSEIAREYKINYPNKDIVAFDPQGRLKDKDGKDIVDIKLFDNDFFNLLDKKDFLLIIDDHRMLLPNDTLDKDFLRLLALRDENGIDIFLVTHHPALIQPRLTYYITHLFIFYTNLDEEKTGVGQKVVNATKVNELMQTINTHVINKGKGTYPNFPYIIYDYQEDKHKRVNF